MSRAVVVGLRPHYLIVPKLNTQHMTVTSRDVTTQLRIQRRGPRGRFPYFQTKQRTEGRKKIFFFTGIDSCSLTAVSSAQVLNLFIYFYCHC